MRWESLGDNTTQKISKIIPPPRGFIWTDNELLSFYTVAVLCFYNAVISVLECSWSNSSPASDLFLSLFMQFIPIYSFILIYPIHLYYHMHLYFGFLDKSNMFYSQAQEGYLNVSLVQSTACNVTTSRARHKHGISLKPWSRAEPRSEPQQQPILDAPIANYSTFLHWQIPNSRAY